jgi:short/branched chain acyl-CoA dehydrogenase
MAALTRTLRCVASTSKALASAPSARVAVARTFSTSLRSRMDEPEPALLNSLNNLTEEEQALKEAVIKFGEDVLTPDKVRKMDEAEQMDPDVVQALFEAGVSCTAARSVAH